ncbi:MULTISPECIES: DUF397 domain-containing protein [unclassified Streptomyces]|uniref:DUF397 domain-containing protein n=1 Tax=unclassified Streptomyces TaxID=2593676 RepID=UPI0013BA9DCF|nr:DUF397 domain-containing protein [Streptomyces sp. GMY02]MYX47282.1 DUF397 domain-containing protein [Streptomyces sp. SID89]NMO35330.1 DUF397 domain-containing protein [Streptomyces sp. GMY02]
MKAVPESSWFKSSYSSGAGGECVEVAAWQGTTRVRDSKDTTRPAVRFTPQAWTEFIEKLPGDE